MIVNMFHKMVDNLMTYDFSILHNTVKKEIKSSNTKTENDKKGNLVLVQAELLSIFHFPRSDYRGMPNIN